MNCYHSSPTKKIVTINIALLMLLLVNLGNSQTNSSVQCPYRIICTEHTMMLELPADPEPVKLVIRNIDYIDTEYSFQYLEAYDQGNCLPSLLYRLDYSSFAPFLSTSSSNVSFFNCSSVREQHLRNTHETYNNAQDLLFCPIYAADSYYGIAALDLLSCTKLFDRVFPGSINILGNSFKLTWSDKNFDRRCIFECTQNSTVYNMQKLIQKPKKKPTTIILAATGTIVGSVMLALALVAFFRLYFYFKTKGEDHVRVENFLKDYKAMKPTRFSYADIKRITHRFKDKLGEGSHGAVYKGKLSNQILVAVKILSNTEDDGTEFINEVGTMGKIHHVNVVRLLGFCADGFHRALVYDYFPNGSLQNFISQSTNKDSNSTFLGWDKLQQISLGIAKGIQYLHQGCDQRILHFDINPHNVLLDDNFTPKISDFGLAKLCSKNRSTVSMTAARGTLGYMAPEVFSRNFGNVSYKSDIYSYGMLLLEMVGGRKNTNTGSQDTSNLQVLYPDWIHSLLEGGEIHVPIDEEGNSRVTKKLAIVGLWCIQWNPVHRPNMKTVMQMLEGEVEKLKVPRNPFGSTPSTDTSASTAARRLNLELEVIQEFD